METSYYILMRYESWKENLDYIKWIDFIILSALIKG